MPVINKNNFSGGFTKGSFQHRSATPFPIINFIEPESYFFGRNIDIFNPERLGLICPAFPQDILTGVAGTINAVPLNGIMFSNGIKHFILNNNRVAFVSAADEITGHNDNTIRAGLVYEDAYHYADATSEWGLYSYSDNTQGGVARFRQSDGTWETDWLRTAFGITLARGHRHLISRGPNKEIFISDGTTIHAFFPGTITVTPNAFKVDTDIRIVSMSLISGILIIGGVKRDNQESLSWFWDGLVDASQVQPIPVGEGELFSIFPTQFGIFAFIKEKGLFKIKQYRKGVWNDVSQTLGEYSFSPIKGDIDDVRNALFFSSDNNLFAFGIPSPYHETGFHHINTITGLRMVKSLGSHLYLGASNEIRRVNYGGIYGANSVLVDFIFLPTKSIIQRIKLLFGDIDSEKNTNITFDIFEIGGTTAVYSKTFTTADIDRRDRSFILTGKLPEIQNFFIRITFNNTSTGNRFWSFKNYSIEYENLDIL